MPGSAHSIAQPDVIVVGSGPNGLTAGIRLARAGFAVKVLEAADTPGGGCRSAALTLPGFTHDICAAIHPTGVLSPAFREIGLARAGLAWIESPHPLAHPLPDGGVAVLERSPAATAARLGRDEAAWQRMLRPFADENFIASLLAPLWYPSSGYLVRKARFALNGLRSAAALARGAFRGEPARALLAGCAAHSVMPLERAGTASFGLVLAAAGHAVGWPCARGGSQAITAALVEALTAAGGVLRLGHHVRELRELPPARAVLFDLSPRQVAAIAGEALPARCRDRLARFRHGAGIFKVDWALRAPIPWRNPECRAAMTVHAGGGCDEILRSEAEVGAGRAPERPFVLVAQQSLFDESRAPAGRHTGWSYCHVPGGCEVDMTDRIETQVERFAPGFRDCILARHTMGPAQLESHNPAMIGGDMSGGQNDLFNFLFRPAPQLNPYATPNPRLFLCSSSTPPGGGVHGMCGWHAAGAVIRTLRSGRRAV